MARVPVTANYLFRIRFESHKEIYNRVKKQQTVLKVDRRTRACVYVSVSDGGGGGGSRKSFSNAVK